MKCETWIDGNMEIVHVISFCSYIKNSKRLPMRGNRYLNGKGLASKAWKTHFVMILVLYPLFYVPKLCVTNK